MSATTVPALPRRLLPLLLAREWRHHPWRHAVALLAVALGVALAWSVHLINVSALAEFSAAVRSANGEPDLTLRAGRDGFDDALFERVAMAPGVLQASPVLEVDTFGRSAGGARVALRLLGVDALRLPGLATELLPRAASGEARTVALDPAVVFLNAGARSALAVRDGDTLQLQQGTAWLGLRVAGSIAAGGTPLLAMDIAGAQEAFALPGRLSRIDLRLRPGTDAAALLRGLALPPEVRAAPADEAEQRLSNLSRAYRVNLSVLALVALFVGAFLVFSVLSLSVAQRTPMLALLGVLGLDARQRRRLVLAECAALGLLGGLLGVAAGTAMAWGALRWMAGDLGGGYFPGIAPPLQFNLLAAAGFVLLGLLSALVGGWWPARQAQAIAPAQALKGLGSLATGNGRPAVALALLGAGVALAFGPPLFGLPLLAYLSVAALLFGGVAAVPVVVGALLAPQRTSNHPLWLLALRRARFHRHTATAAVAGVVASLALSVALTVMVASFRQGVSTWLDRVLPADLYGRTAPTSALAEQAWLDASVLPRAAALPGVQRVQAARLKAMNLRSELPAVTLVARELGDPAQSLPLLAAPLPVPPGELGVYVSEATAALYGAQVGTQMQLPIGTAGTADALVKVRVLGIWRDYARQFGAVAMDLPDYRRRTGDTRINELALWLQPGADLASVRSGVRALSADPAMLEFAATGELRALSLRIFDRSFAVTYYLQAVAIAIGLVGIAASLSAQVLARRKEFGLLAHLGFTRGQVLRLVAAESALWLAAGCGIGLALGVALSVVLVHVVNPQSFHWTMELLLPWGRLALLCAAVLAAGVATAAFSARAAAGRSAVLSVKEDW